jgi:glycosidase
MPNHPPKSTFEFHISRQARDTYQFDENLFSLGGNVVFANFHAARVFAQRMNARRDLIHYPERAVQAGQVTAMGLIDEILHYVVGLYRQQINPQVMGEALFWLSEVMEPEAVEAALRQFGDEFPPLAVYRQEISLDDYLDGETEGIPHREIMLEEMILLWLGNVNPAFAPYQELFDDTNLERHTAYPVIIKNLADFFETQPGFGPQHQFLIDMLRSPAIAVPHSLPGQLEYIREHWADLLGRFLYRLLSSLDLIREEEKARFLGPGTSRVYEFVGLDEERFSPDQEWMPKLVLLAKNAYVWLDQLSKTHQREITRLDQVPDEELDKLTGWGFTGLWLIGLWERSSASQRIKQLCGNPEAVASAYSLYDYVIATDLGGEAAYDNLRHRAWQRGIRLAADMVPNHVGIYSKWVIEHPDWFISLDYCPFPSHSFNGENLSKDPRVGIYLEDHYYSRTDAAVEFKRVDHWTGDTRYIYHGNDGTSMPWNDTAQLNYLEPEVREAAIQTILHVARKFPVIRFDAAMTLSKKHYQRLWFPEPGSGGDIPTRSDFGLTKEQFDAAMPKEFWREVVDRVAEEIPDTLLLAEAFWLMEGYFVRTLGMHRVYNSAFMNMLRDEKNADYRQLIKNTLEFDPQILKRYVNFMSNPDEETAVGQFGKDDKYFGICTMMATMPGLPMFGHGQIEGFTEKYGMEFRRAYWDEHPDDHLVGRHQREIFPLLHHRYLFAEVDNFLLYDFYAPEGHVNENVFAYSNRSGDQRGLVVYHNKWAEARGWVRTSASYKDKGRPDGALVQKSLGEGLGLDYDGNTYTIFRDQIIGLEFIRNNVELYEKGLYIELGAYKYQAFLDFRQVADNEWRQYAQLTAYLDGRGVPSVEEAMKEIFLQPLHYPFRELVNAGMFRWLISNRVVEGLPESPDLGGALVEAEQKMIRLLEEVSALTHGGADTSALAAEVRSELEAVLRIATFHERFLRHLESATILPPLDQPIDLEDSADDPKESHHSQMELAWGTLLSWSFTHSLGKILGESDYAERGRSWIDEWLLNKIIAQALQNLSGDPAAAWHALNRIKILIGHQDWFQEIRQNGERSAYDALQAWLKDGDIAAYLGVNRYQGTLWFNQESFEELLGWMAVIACLKLAIDTDLAESQMDQEVEALAGIIIILREAEAASEYQVEKLLAAAKG